MPRNRGFHASAPGSGARQETCYVYPSLLNEIGVEDKIQFSVITSAGAKVSADEQDEFTWALADCQSVSDYLGKETEIGSIDPRSGEFTAVGLGTCKVTLRNSLLELRNPEPARSVILREMWHPAAHSRITKIIQVTTVASPVPQDGPPEN